MMAINCHDDEASLQQSFDYGLFNITVIFGTSQKMSANLVTFQFSCQYVVRVLYRKIISCSGQGYV